MRGPLPTRNPQVTDPPRRRSLKWKPPSENSIDFLLQLKFPASKDRSDQVDLFAKPFFMLMMNHGQGDMRFFDTMEVEDDTWEECVLFASLVMIGLLM